VTATTATGKLDFVASLGADDVLDYTTTDFTRLGKGYDLIIEVGGELTFPKCMPALKPGGKLLIVGAGSGVGGPIGRFVNCSFRTKVLRQPVLAFVSWESVDDLVTLGSLVDEERLWAPIDRTYALSDAAEAITYLESGNVRGKVVITVD
jgi:NADPH:quinone reductase-like Zn-dependent oxidoreductase